LSVALCLVAAPARAAEFGAGVCEFRTNSFFTHGSGSFDGEHVFSLTQANIEVGLGFFANRHLEPEVALGIVHQAVDIEGLGSTSATATAFSGGLRVNFPAEGRIMPFVAAGAGVQTNGSGSETSVIAPYAGGGVRLMLHDVAAVDFAAQYEHVTNYLGAKDVSGNLFGVSAGLSVFLGR